MATPMIVTAEPQADIDPFAAPVPTREPKAERQRAVALAMIGLGAVLSVSWAGFLGWSAVQLASYVLG